MVSRLLLGYAVVELMAVVGLASAIGLGWTLLVLLATFVLGLVVWAPMGGLQLGRQVMQLRSGLKDPRTALSDGALVAMATGLVLVPGLVTTTLGLLLLVPPIRAVARPGLTALVGRGLAQRVPLIDVTVGDEHQDHHRQDFIDGEVIDVQEGWVGEPPVLPPSSDFR
ncbi:FxsA family protein [Mycobacterium riyadhense]|uniref:FxsA family protein n=1 Tax=Mycobacterium riyadhense TaxID=486698 RepID=UPI00194EC990|nr:FxsA family protein [Mycobacterium riyadhense]